MSYLASNTVFSGVVWNAFLTASPMSRSSYVKETHGSVPHLDAYKEKMKERERREREKVR